jgi:hypothetical protein
MARYTSLNATLETLDERLKMLEVKDESHFLGFSWPTTDGLHVEEKWVFNNWNELIQRFIDVSPIPVKDITGPVRLTVIEPITSTRETRRVTADFSAFVHDMFQRENRKRYKQKELFTEKGHKPSDRFEDYMKGKKWGNKFRR